MFPVPGSDDAVFRAYATKTVDFRYRGLGLRLALSHGLFSSADVDSGSRLLLRVLSALIDADAAAGRPLPRTVLDCGSGVGVLGIAAALALRAAGVDGVRVRSQDRDELARVFSARNAAANGLEPGALDAYAERLLGGPADARYGLILSNLPAKAGPPVLADFFRRSARMLDEGGKAAVVIVDTLADAARAWLRDAGAPLLREERGTEHAVFVYGRAEGLGAAEAPDAYFRTEAEHELEGVRCRIRALHGVADFSEPSRTVVAAARLAAGLGPFRRALVHESGQGHFPAFLAAAAVQAGRKPPALLLCGRNALALEASSFNAARAAGGHSAIETAPAADLGLCAAGTADAGLFDLVASFPEIVPRTDPFPALWKGAGLLAAAGGHLLVALPSTEAARFDRLKTAEFVRAGDFKRDGARALAYRRR